MSSRALLKGVESRLREELSDPQGKIVGVQPDGRPPPSAGQWFYAVHPGGITGDDPNSLSHDRLYAVTVTITARMGYAPRDRRGERMTLDQELLDRAEQVADWLHQDDGHRILANQLISGTAEWADLQTPPTLATDSGFVEPLRLLSISPVQQVPSEWFGAQDGSDVYVAVVNLGNARRIRPL